MIDSSYFRTVESTRCIAKEVLRGAVAALEAIRERNNDSITNNGGLIKKERASLSSDVVNSMEKVLLREAIPVLVVGEVEVCL